MKTKRFSLIEVIIATVILSMSAVVAVQMTSRSHARTFEVEGEWSRQHLLSMGAEFHLLFGHEAELPEDLLPGGYSIDCQLLEAEIPEDTIDEEKYEPINGWVLGEYFLTLMFEGDELDTLSILKFVPEDELQ